MSKRWKDGDVASMLDVMKSAIEKTEWLKPEEQNIMIKWIDSNKPVDNSNNCWKGIHITGGVL